MSGCRCQRGVLSVIRHCFALSVILVGAGCSSHKGTASPQVELTVVPAADPGGPDIMEKIQGRVTGAPPGSRIVLFSRSRIWWVQPAVAQPVTSLNADSTFNNSTHLGTEYAALLVNPSYRPPFLADSLPPVGGDVLARVIVPGDPTKVANRRILNFSGYEWLVRSAPSDRGGQNNFDADNAWTDDQGALHLRLTGSPGNWKCAEVVLQRTLGYGTYRFVVRDTSELDPAAVFSIFTWDGPAEDQNRREMNIEVSHWGEGGRENTRYTIQPYYIAGNTNPFVSPAGPLTHTLRWESGRASFRTARGAQPGGAGPLVAEKVFTSGVPSSGNERIRFSLYAFHRGAQQVQQPSEVVIERFEYLP